MLPVVAPIAVLPVAVAVGVVSHPHCGHVLNSLRPPVLAAESQRRYHLCLVKGARCIAVIVSGRSKPLAVLAAMTRTATAIVEAAMRVAIPVSAEVTYSIAE